MDVLANHDEDLKQMDIELCNLYFKAIYNLLDMDDQRNIDGFTRYLELLRTETNANCEFYENSKDQDDSLRDLFFDNLFYRIAYVYRNSTLYSSAVAFQFQNVLHHNPKLLKRLIHKQTIHLCSIGCGPASDVVALIKVLESACRRRGVSPDFRITVVDAIMASS
ncbi:hypothetical protein JTE90_007085 [Oedothorax gibbosus]|uniref:Uncharacterized protein n=1 Tax=Oedothorax gibbosus TaxID=931172 RepID=A0AAV6VQI6_9ARAC|nr:hypothetical protein JTE90_007085 [Oedothorax gibbosus]